MRRILLGLLTVGSVVGITVYATNAFFQDTETSTDNTFTAGKLDLKIDFDGYYNKVADGTPNAGSWTEKDLAVGVDKFFNFTDVKPGDFGEGTISLHLYDNDGWGRMVIENVNDLDNSCTEPEIEDEPGCVNEGLGTGTGELRENLSFYAWLDQGETPGFQNIGADGQPIDDDPVIGGIQKPDPTEGDNIWQESAEPQVITPGTIDASGETHNFWPALAAYRLSLNTDCDGTDPDGDGHAGYDVCQGLADDGRLVGSTTYYMGIYWTLPGSVNDSVQSDSLVADVKFETQQHRNVPTPFPTP